MPHPDSPADRAAATRAGRGAPGGWAASVDELEVGLAGVAAPVRAVDGAVVAAVSVSGPTARIIDRGVAALGELLVAELRRLSAQLGAHAGVSPSPDRAKPRR